MSHPSTHFLILRTESFLYPGSSLEDADCFNCALVNARVWEADMVGAALQVLFRCHSICEQGGHSDICRTLRTELFLSQKLTSIYHASLVLPSVGQCMPDEVVKQSQRQHLALFMWLHFAASRVSADVFGGAGLLLQQHVCVIRGGTARLHSKDPCRGYVNLCAALLRKVATCLCLSIRCQKASDQGMGIVVWRPSWLQNTLSKPSLLRNLFPSFSSIQ